MAESVTKGLTKLKGNLYIEKDTGDIFIIHGNWLKTAIGSIAGTESFEIFERSFGTENGKETREALAELIEKNLNL